MLMTMKVVFDAEETAMKALREAVHSVAPEAQVAFHTHRESPKSAAKPKPEAVASRS